MNIDFSRLEQLSSKLNQSSESLNESLKLVEAKFAQLRLGVEAFLVVETDDESDHVTYFSYAKRSGKWGLFFTYDSGPKEVACEPFSQASRELRLKALNMIPDLVALLEKRAEELLGQLRTSQQAVESVLREK